MQKIVYVWVGLGELSGVMLILVFLMLILMFVGMRMTIDRVSLMIGGRRRIIDGDSGLEDGSHELGDFEVFGMDIILKIFDIVFKGTELELVVVFDLIDGGFQFGNVLG
jgi:hypothetical protein